MNCVLAFIVILDCDLPVCGTSSLEELPGLLENVSIQRSVGFAWPGASKV